MSVLRSSPAVSSLSPALTDPVPGPAPWGPLTLVGSAHPCSLSCNQSPTQCHTFTCHESAQQESWQRVCEVRQRSKCLQRTHAAHRELRWGARTQRVDPRGSGPEDPRQTEGTWPQDPGSGLDTRSVPFLALGPPSCTLRGCVLVASLGPGRGLHEEWAELWAGGTDC